MAFQIRKVSVIDLSGFIILPFMVAGRSCGNNLAENN